MSTRFDDETQLRGQRLADLQERTAELERELSDTRMSLQREMAGPGGRANGTGPVRSPDERTQTLLNNGRQNAYKPGLPRRWKIAIGTAFAVAAVIVAAMVLSGGGASWPSSVTTVQNEVAQACQNPDVKSEPGQVNFACATATRQILWVFALLTSTDNPGYASATTGRVGLEPINPGQGGEIAWTLNLHHPYRPSNPVDSLQVAARAINNIIGGATLTRANGSPKVEPGLEGSPGNCLRYTGSAALTSRRGYPTVCARAVSSTAGQAALVADVYQKWVVGTSPQAAQNAAVLFENVNNPGDPRVQAILKHLLNARSQS
jgi:hypothetical protein